VLFTIIYDGEQRMSIGNCHSFRHSVFDQLTQRTLNIHHNRTNNHRLSLFCRFINTECSSDYCGITSESRTRYDTGRRNQPKARTPIRSLSSIQYICAWFSRLLHRGDLNKNQHFTVKPPLPWQQMIGKSIRFPPHTRYFNISINFAAFDKNHVPSRFKGVT
jgi:hypothetical protein